MMIRGKPDDRDRILLSRGGPRRALSPAQRRASLWTLTAGLIGSTVLLWVMVQLGQASDPAGRGARPAPTASPATVSSAATPPATSFDSAPPDEASLAPPASALQGPAVDTPREVLDMLDQRARHLDQREGALREGEAHLAMLRTEIEKLLAANEALEKRINKAQEKQEQQSMEGRASQAKAQADRERQAQAQKTENQARLAKIYESMAPEEAAARLERMPDRKAVEVLRLVKSKTAGSILSQVKADRAAKLTEELLSQAQ